MKLSNPIKPLFLASPQRMALRARAVHRLARKKRWPAYMFAAIVQETPHEFSGPDHTVESLAMRLTHVLLIYLSFTLIEF